MSTSPVDPAASAREAVDSDDPDRMVDWLNDQVRRLNDGSIPLADAQGELAAGITVYRALQKRLEDDRRLAARLSTQVEAALK